MSGHVEFPELTPEARAACEAGYKAAFPWHDGHKKEWTESNRKSQAAFLREAMKRALDNDKNWNECWNELEAIAANLHSPPRPRQPWRRLGRPI